MKCAVVCTAFVYKCMFIYKNKLNDIALYYKVLFGVIFWEILPASCCLVSTKHSMIYKCCYVFSVLLALKLEWMYHAIDIISNMKIKKRLLWNLWRNSSTSIAEINKAFTDIVQQPFFCNFHCIIICMIPSVCANGTMPAQNLLKKKFTC